MNKEKFKALKLLCPTPDVDELLGLNFEIDGGGRELIDEIIGSFENEVLIVEIGAFLCGSSRRWLKASQKSFVIAVDPWEGLSELDVCADIKGYGKATWAQNVFKRENVNPATLIEEVKEFGWFKVACAAVKEFEDRFIPVRSYSPGALVGISEFGLTPDIIYIDAGKVIDDLEAAHVLFPNSILCGDDWNWGNEEMGYPMQEAVKKFCAENSYSYKYKLSTWVIYK